MVGKKELYDIFEVIYPVGIIIDLTVPTNPKDLFGIGEWEQIKDCFLLAAGDSYTAGNKGGSNYITIQEKNIPSIPVWINFKPGGNYAHSKNDTYNQIVHIGMLGTETSGYPLSTTGVWPTNGMKYGNRGYDLHVGVVDSEAIPNMPPYYVCYRWKRVS